MAYFAFNSDRSYREHVKEMLEQAGVEAARKRIDLARRINRLAGQPNLTRGQRELLGLLRDEQKIEKDCGSLTCLRRYAARHPELNLRIP